MFKLITRLLVVLAFSWAGSASAIPITDTVTLDGKEWAQPADFTGISWNTIFAVCGAGPCIGNLIVPFRFTYEMDGWTWASNAQVQSLFNTFTGRNDTAPTLFTEAYSEWAPAVLAVFDSSFSPGFGSDYVAGWTSSLDAYGRGYLPFVRDDNGDRPDLGGGDDEVSTKRTNFVFQQFESAGAWFVRDAKPVPTPATLALFGLALACMWITRRKCGAKVSLF